MKTIKQLEKEIEKIEKEKGDLEYLDVDWIGAKAQLSQTKTIKKMIEEIINDITGFKLNDWKDDGDIEIKDKTLNLILKEEILLKIEGEEELTCEGCNKVSKDLNPCEHCGFQNLGFPKVKVLNKEGVRR